MINLKKRHKSKEFLDDTSQGFEVHHEAYEQLEFINKYTYYYTPILNAVKAAWKKHKKKSKEPIRILDIGFGNGDVLRKISDWSKKNKIPVILTGVDINPWSEKSARIMTPKKTNIRFLITDVFNHRPRKKHDLIISTQMLHHLSDEKIVKLIKWMTKNSNIGWFVLDLHRHLIPYYFVKYAFKIVKLNKMMQHDAITSFSKAFTSNDWKNYLNKSKINLKKVSIKWHVSFRYGINYYH